MDVISVINYKGGVGKTTLTANLGAELAYQGLSVLLIDLDPQANLTFSFLSVDDWRDNYQNRTIKNWYDAFIDNDSDLDISTLVSNPQRVNERLKTYKSDGKIDLICSHLGLINVDTELAARVTGTPRQVRNNFLRVHSRLLTGLGSLYDEEGYDVVLIDCPPNFNIVTKTALVASDWYLVPAKPDYLSTLGINQLSRHVSELVEDYNRSIDEDDGPWRAIDPEMLGIVFTMVSIRNDDFILAQKQYAAEVGRLGLPVLDAYIRENKTLYADAPQTGIPLVLHQVSALDTYRRVRAELEELAEEIGELTGLL